MSPTLVLETPDFGKTFIVNTMHLENELELYRRNNGYH